MRHFSFAVFAAAFLQAIAVAQVDWTMLAASGAPPSHAASAWDTDRDRLVAFGGYDASGLTDATVEWDGVAWTLHTPTVAPSARFSSGMAYDSVRQETVLFGGSQSTGQEIGQTWTWNGVVWQQRSPTTAPSPRTDVAMTFDAARGVVVLFGGASSTTTFPVVFWAETWEWNGITWTKRWTGSAQPSSRRGARLTFDAARGVCVLCGGSDANGGLDDAWTWNGTAWAQVASMPETRQSHLLAYDHGRQRVVAYGGHDGWWWGTYLNDTIEWDGVTWTQRVTPNSPGYRAYQTYGFDPVRGHVVMAGGAGTPGLYTDTLALVPLQPATATSFGSGCTSSAGPVQLVSETLPYIGQSFVQRLTGAPASAAVGVVAFGLSTTQWSGVPLPIALGSLGAPPCAQLLVAAEATATVGLVNGAGAIAWTLPGTAALVGATFHTQGFVLDPLSPFPLPLVSSPGRTNTIGSP